jgi:hypothetical protein
LGFTPVKASLLARPGSFARAPGSAFRAARRGEPTSARAIVTSHFTGRPARLPLAESATDPDGIEPEPAL